MATINFTACGADVIYELADNGKREELLVNDESIIDSWGDLGAWGADYHYAIAGLHGAAKASAEIKYLRNRAEHLLIEQLFCLREELRDLRKSI